MKPFAKCLECDVRHCELCGRIKGQCSVPHCGAGIPRSCLAAHCTVIAMLYEAFRDWAGLGVCALCQRDDDGMHADGCDLHEIVQHFDL